MHSQFDTRLIASIARVLLASACSALLAHRARALQGQPCTQPNTVSTQSDGSDGVLDLSTFVGDAGDPNTMTIDLSLAASGLDAQGQPIRWSTPSPVAGRGVYDPVIWAVVFKYSSVSVPANKTIRFRNHTSRAPVVWLCQGDVTIAGTVTVSGQELDAQTFPNGYQVYPLEPGPGGFRGGMDHLGTQAAGFGPGGGFDPPGNGAGLYSGAGAFAPDPAHLFWAVDGGPYGSPAVFPLIGGSGGGGRLNTFGGTSVGPGEGGGPGGGALLLAANQRISLLATGRLFAFGGFDVRVGGGGSGGALRLVAHEFVQQSSGTLQAQGGLSDNPSFSRRGGDGRIRVEADCFHSVVTATPAATSSTPSQILPDSTTATIRVVSVRHGTQTVVVPFEPRSQLNFQADVVLDQIGTAAVDVETSNVLPGRTCSVRVTDAYGDAAVYATGPLVPAPLPGNPTRCVVSIDVTIPTGVCAVQARVVL